MEPSSASVALRVDGLTKMVGKRYLLDNVSFSVPRGQAFACLGPNGAGKTTTLACILGLSVPNSGVIEILGETTLTNQVKGKLGFLPEQAYFPKHLTGMEFLRWNGQLSHMSNPDIVKRSHMLLGRMALAPAADKRLGTYSKGMLQRIGLAQAMMHEPEILFLDEPMSGLDPIGRKMVLDLLIDLKNAGTTIFLNTHILSDVERLAESYCIIHE